LKDPSDANVDALLKAFQRSAKTRPLHLSDIVRTTFCLNFLNSIIFYYFTLIQFLKFLHVFLNSTDTLMFSAILPYLL
jgi:hypothetical protein